MTDEQWEETRALRERAEAIADRKPGADGVVDITHSEFLEVRNHAQTILGMRSDFVEVSERRHSWACLGVLIGHRRWLYRANAV